MKACDFIGILFLSRDVAHSVHLNTRSFSKHMALDTFYNGIVPLTDHFAEAYQGRHGMIGPVVLMKNSNTTNVLDFLVNSLKQIEDNRLEVCDKSDTAIQNIIDEIVGLYLTTIYKLKFLA